MNSLKVLDCTLRDGGYCNDCQFGLENEKKIVDSLIKANIDIIECGFLIDTIKYDPDITRFAKLDQISQIIPLKKEGKTFVALADYGKFDPDKLPEYDGFSVDGLRIAFHKKDCVDGLKVCQKVKEKGYKVFVQAMVSVSYTDEEFLKLISQVNDIEPYAFYIVDSFGMMKQKDLTRLFYIVEHNLKDNIQIGFHSHNNMQLAYSNAQFLVNLQTERNLIIDSSVYGMGRGAGNLNTEIFVEYLNENANGNYDLKPLLAIIDEILGDFYQKNHWGYSLPNYLSAAYNAHPNYAGYLDNKKTLTVQDMNEIFRMMDEEKKFFYDQVYIEKLYVKYMAKEHTEESHLAELKHIVAGKSILLIAPGKSIEEERDNVLAVASQDNVITISVNFDYAGYDTDYIFISNLRRFRELKNDRYSKCIITSNISSVDAYLQVQYSDLTNEIDVVRDNAGLMLIKFLIQVGVQKVLLAGMDGYSVDPTQNFADQHMNFYAQKGMFEAMNEGMTEILSEYANRIQIQYVTTPKNIHIN